jgi:hypothetical protein
MYGQSFTAVADSLTFHHAPTTYWLGAPQAVSSSTAGRIGVADELRPRLAVPSRTTHAPSSQVVVQTTHYGGSTLTALPSGVGDMLGVGLVFGVGLVGARQAYLAISNKMGKALVTRLTLLRGADP